MAGGKAIEHLAQSGNQELLTFRLPMQQYRNCDFSFSGLQNLVNNAIGQKEKEEGIFRQSDTNWALDDLHSGPPFDDILL